MKTLPGLIIRSQSGFYTVRTDDGDLVSRLRGRLKKGPRLGDVAALGDRVQVTPLGKEKGMIEAIEPRQRMLSRMAPTPSGEYQQIIIANPDQAVFIFSCQQPEPRFGMLDRFLVIAEKQDIPAMIAANKVDLVGLETAQIQFERYPAVGYLVAYTSAKTMLGVDELRHSLAGKVSVFAGPSGVGKSSLLNVILPGLDLREQEVSQATSKGRHTTVVREMFPLAEGAMSLTRPD